MTRVCLWWRHLLCYTFKIMEREGILALTLLPLISDASSDLPPPLPSPPPLHSPSPPPLFPPPFPPLPPIRLTPAPPLIPPLPLPLSLRLARIEM